ARLFAAERLARADLHAIVYEEHAVGGDPVHCTAILAAESFDEFDLPRDALLNTLTAAQFVSPSGITIGYRTSTPLAAVIDRPAFDRSLARRTAAAGAEIRTGARVTTLEIDASGVRARAGDSRIRARLAILACGAQYALQRRLGLGLPSMYLHTAQRELPAERLSDVELHFGREVAPQGFAWAVPVARPEGLRVRIGVMARSDALGAYGRMLDSTRARWGIDAGAPAPRQKILPLGAIGRTVGDR